MQNDDFDYPTKLHEEADNALRQDKYELAFEKLYELSKDDDSWALYMMGYLHHMGLGTDENLAIAIDYYKRAGRLDVPQALEILGWLYIYGHGVEQEKRGGASLILKAAQLGLPTAQYDVGLMFLAGENFDQNFKYAFDFVTLAEAQGVADAKGTLGHMYQNGLGVEKDLDIALEYLQKGVVCCIVRDTGHAGNSGELRGVAARGSSLGKMYRIRIPSTRCAYGRRFRLRHCQCKYRHEWS